MRLTLAGDCGIDHYVASGIERAGGCTLNVAAHLRSLAPAAWDIDVVSAVGDDAAAAIVRTALSACGYGRLVRTLAGETARQSIRLHPDGEKNFCGYAPGVLAQFAPDQEQIGRLLSSNVVVTVAYAEVVELVESLVKAARQVRLVVDFMSMRDFDGDLTQIVRWLDVVQLAYFGLERHQTQLIGQIESWQRATPGKVAVVTLGAAGALVMHGSETTMVGAEPVERVVDTTGAGDAFLAAFLSRYLNDETPAAAARFAARHAAGVVQKIGAF